MSFAIRAVKAGLDPERANVLGLVWWPDAIKGEHIAGLNEFSSEVLKLAVGACIFARQKSPLPSQVIQRAKWIVEDGWDPPREIEIPHSFAAIAREMGCRHSEELLRPIVLGDDFSSYSEVMRSEFKAVSFEDVVLLNALPARTIRRAILSLGRSTPTVGCVIRRAAQILNGWRIPGLKW